MGIYEIWTQNVLTTW